MLLAAGCQQSAPPSEVPVERTPIEKLEALAAGLDDLLSNRHSAAGVTVQSEVKHRLIPANRSDEPPSAEVTIGTKRFFVMIPEDSGSAAEPVSTGEAPGGSAELEIDPNTEIIKDKETKVYELAYLDDQWQLKTELTDVSEQVLFDRALRMQ